MILGVKENPAPTVNISIGSDLTGHTPSKRSGRMVTFRRKRRKSTKGRARKTSRRATRVRSRRNPKRKRSRKRARRRSSPTRGSHRPRLTYKGGKWYGGKTSRSLIKRGSGTRVNKRRSRRTRRRARRNPAGVRGIQKMFSRNALMSTAKAGAGIAIGFTAMPIFYKILPQQLKEQRQWLGGIHVALGLAIAGFVRNRNVKDIGLVIAATGVYDLIAMNVDFLGLPPLRTSSPLADRLSPPTSAPAVAAPGEGEAAAGCYGGNLEMTHYGTSYPVMAAPVSRVASHGVGASFERVGASYPSLAYPTIGLSGDGGTDMGLDDMIN